MNRTHYEILCVDPKATKEEITLAYRRQAFKYHPDRSSPHAQQENTQKFKEAKTAYDVLKDPTQRAAYDEAIVKQNFSQSPPYSGQTAHNPRPNPPTTPSHRRPQGENYNLQLSEYIDAINLNNPHDHRIADGVSFIVLLLGKLPDLASRCLLNLLPQALLTAACTPLREKLRALEATRYVEVVLSNIQQEINTPPTHQTNIEIKQRELLWILDKFASGRVDRTKKNAERFIAEIIPSSLMLKQNEEIRNAFKRYAPTIYISHVISHILNALNDSDLSNDDISVEQNEMIWALNEFASDGSDTSRKNAKRILVQLRPDVLISNRLADINDKLKMVIDPTDYAEHMAQNLANTLNTPPYSSENSSTRILMAEQNLIWLLNSFEDKKETAQTIHGFLTDYGRNRVPSINQMLSDILTTSPRPPNWQAPLKRFLKDLF